MADGILIDEKGQRWADRSWSLLGRLGRYGVQLDPVSYAVRECGFIHIRPQETGARVALHVGRFGLETLAGTLYELKERQFPRILVAKLVEGEWRYEMVGGTGAFAVCAEQLMAGEMGDEGRPWIATERKLGALALPEFAQVRPLVELWRASRGRMPEELDGVLRGSQLVDRLILVRRRPQTSRLVFAHFGAGIECRAQGESERLIDRDVHEHHDRAYGAWVAPAYAEALAGNRPHLRSIRATVCVSDKIVARGRYDRLILPWRGRGSEDFAMGISLTRDHRCFNAYGQIGQQRAGIHP